MDCPKHKSESRSRFLKTYSNYDAMQMNNQRPEGQKTICYVNYDNV